MSNKLTTLTETDFATKLADATVPLLIDYSAEKWCRPCIALVPILEDLVSESDGKFEICKVDVDDSPALAKQFGVKSVPCIIAFKDGQEIGRLIGLQSKESILKLLE